MKKNRIEVSVVHKKKLYKKYGTSMTTIQQSLDYYRNSELSKSIRRSAKQMLLDEAAEIED